LRDDGDERSCFQGEEIKTFSALCPSRKMPDRAEVVLLDDKGKKERSSWV
jgi:hypothetical protein